MNRSIALGLLVALGATACDGESTSDADGGADAGPAMDAGRIDGGPDEDGGPGDEDGGPGTDAGVDASGPDGGPGGPSLEDFGDDYRRAFCELLLECESKLGGLALLVEQFCHPAAQSLFAGISESVTAGTVTYDPDAARACLDDFTALGCADLYALSSPFEMLCQDVFTPTVPVDGACARDEECVDGRCELGASCPGTCVALSGAGTPCADDEECAPGLSCVPGGTCELQRGDGGDCNGDDDCTSGLYCAGGTCSPRPTSGESCERPFGASECADALLCAGPAGSRTCEAGAGEGDACDDETPCALGLRCNPGSGSCIRLVPPGGSCSTDRQCPLYFWCDGGSCAPLPVAGESCALAPDCAQGSCVSGTCELAADGETCRGVFASPFGDCDAGLYCDGGSCTSTLSEGDSCANDRECGDTLECRDDGSDDTCRPICTSS